MSSSKIPIAIAYGDGIGPEIMQAVVHVLDEAGAPLEYKKIDIGEKVYLSGHPTGIEDSSWEIIKSTKAFLKAPITTPQGGGFKSLNVTIRTTLGLFANIRPCVAYPPFVRTKHPKMDVVIVRENEEDLYAGIEYRQTPGVCQSLKLISRKGCEKIVRHAFEYARHYGRKKVTCFSKDNIMKFSDGLFHKVFDEIAKEYPHIENEHWIVDIGAAKLADTPEAFDVIVMPNLYGDILSDVAAQISGSVGLAGSANIGDKGAMFEAIHGSAPRRAGQNVANPSGLLLASVMMLVYLGENRVAERIHNAWLKTLEEGVHTYDIFTDGQSKRKVGTKEFAQTIVKFLGEKPSHLPVMSYHDTSKIAPLVTEHFHKKEQRELIGTDIFIFSKESASQVIKKTSLIATANMHLTMISNRGVKIWPKGHPETSCVEQWRLRFMHREKNQAITLKHIFSILEEMEKNEFDVIKMENLYLIDGAPGFSSAEG